MVGYDTGAFGADDGVTPAAACTVILRYMDLPDVEWDYSTACQTALDQGLTTGEAIGKGEITRGDLAVMLYRALAMPVLKIAHSRNLRAERSAGMRMAPSIRPPTVPSMSPKRVM